MLFFTKKAITSSERYPLEGTIKLPTIIQFFNRKYIDFRVCSIATIDSANAAAGGRQAVESDARNNAPISPFADLSYHASAISINGDYDQGLPSLSGDPLLGVWNCRSNLDQINPENKLLELFLDRVIFNQLSSTNPGKDQTEAPSNRPLMPPYPFVISLDLSEPSTIAPLVHSVVDALLAYFSSQTNTRKIYDSNSDTCTRATSLEKLSLIRFGDPPDAPKQEAAGTSERRKTLSSATKISLILACIMPTHQPSSYKEKQAQVRAKDIPENGS